MRKRIRTALVVIWAIFFVVEIAARIWVASHQDRIADTHNPRLMWEHRQIQRDWIDGYPILADYTGQYVNAKNNVRVTAYAPTTALHRLYLFGNSEVYGADVDDRNTIASYLQQLTQRYRVVNVGVSGVVAALQTARLKSLPLRAGDIVVFVDGVQDADGVLFDAQAADRYPLRVWCDHFMFLALAQWSCDPKITPNILSDTEWMNLETAQVLARYNKAIGSAAAFSRAHGATFYHFRQPVMPTHEVSYPGLDAAYAQIWPRMPGTQLQVPDDMFYDWAHTNEAGNAIIARAIFNAIWLVF